MDKCNSDAEFDSYWDNEAKNQNRNRIRVGRQYQAAIPPLLKPGQKDGRKSEELETLKWKPNQLNDQDIEEYLSMAKGIRQFCKSLDNSPKPSEKSDSSSLQSAIKGLSEFVTSHHPCHHDDGCKVARPSSSGEAKSPAANDWSSSEAELFTQALEACGKNFSAIKKEYLPWKPIKSIIEYYYEGKNEKMEESEEPIDVGTTELLSPKKEVDIPDSATEEKPCVKEEPDEPVLETASSPTEDPPKDSITFLENSRVTETCPAVPSELKMAVVENDGAGASSTVGSLKFFLGGRLVLKLNAKQDSGSGTKCQWVQSNDLPKYPNNIKRQKKKCIPESAFPIKHVLPCKSKNRKDDSSRPSPPNRPTTIDCDSAIKKPKLKNSDYEDLFMSSSSWTPPVADGLEVIEVDDTSSKTSEGYVSPVLTNSRHANVKTESYNTGYSADSESKGARGGSNCLESDSASSMYSPNHVNHDVSLYNHHPKSALSTHRAKNLCYQPPHTSHSSSSFLKQLNKWSAQYMTSPLSVLDLKMIPKDNPLDLSSKSNATTQPLHTDSPSKNADKAAILPSESDSPPRPASSGGGEFSPLSSNPGSLVAGGESPFKETSAALINKCGSEEEEECGEEEEEEKCLECDSPEKEHYSHLAYNNSTYCNLPYQCALPKCTKDYLGEVPLDLSSASESVTEKAETKQETPDEKKPENANTVSSDDSDAPGRGMLYQLLKSKTSK